MSFAGLKKIVIRQKGTWAKLYNLGAIYNIK